MEEKQRNTRRSDQEWIALIQECRTSGLGDKDWCEQHGIPISSFYTKITKLRRKACEIPAARHRVIQEIQQVVPLPIIDCYPAFYLVPNHTSFSQIKKRHSINYSDGFYIRLPYAVSLVVL